MILIGGCKYSDKKRLMSTGVDTLLNYNTENYIEESRYEKDLSNIRSEMNLKIDSLKKLLDQNTTLEGNHFHIIVGSFRVESNAINYAKKIKNSGYDGNIIPFNRYNMVTTKSFNNLGTALNELSNVRNAVTENAWVFVSR